MRLCHLQQALAKSFSKPELSEKLFRLLPGPRHGSLAFMLAAEVGFCLTSEGIVLILQRRATIPQYVQGYDVWLGNFRGNHESREHVNLDPDVDSDYWQFSLGPGSEPSRDFVSR